MTEKGYQVGQWGIIGWASIVEETHETNPDLMWPKSIDVFDRMRREDPQVKSVIRAVTLPVIRTEWMLDGAGCRDEVNEFISQSIGVQVKGKPNRAARRRKGRFSMKEHLRMALLCLVYGHSFFEQVYGIDAARQTTLAKLAWRPPRTISKINVARDGGLESIEQYGVDAPIPVSALVAYVNEREGGNWVGESLLRAAYKMALLKDRILRIQALTAERNGLGIPVFTAPSWPVDMDPDEALAWMDQQIARGEEIVKAARAGEEAGLAVGNGGGFKFVGVEGQLPNLDKAIRYYDEQIARAVLAHFLNLGGDSSKGSYALSDVLGGFFTDSLNTIAEFIADVFNQHVIEDLVDLNWGPEEPAPRLVPAPIGERQQVTAEVLKALIECGALIIDDHLKAYVRDRWGLPVESLADETTTDLAEEAA
ncbi:DUF935 domain-containing protein [Microbacterium lacticum]|uniref:DUF935 domain-containing protein n=1 Tax=Microbacterium lacticum TaxID=33885 RepID=UPI001F5A91D0|nr:DUF935 domain-containing protein [Microbacterium lacticum]